MALHVCVYKSYEFRFTGLTCNEQTGKVPRTNQRPKCKLGKAKKNKTTRNKQTNKQAGRQTDRQINK